MINYIRTNSQNKDFMQLVAELDYDLHLRNGAEQAFYSQFNKIDKINHVIIAYANDQPVGCGAIKSFDNDTAEIKRMFVPKDHRGKGIASTILTKLESWATELKYKKCILETGKKQQEAIGLYKKHEYRIIPNYGQYMNVENSICFEKLL